MNWAEVDIMSVSEWRYDGKRGRKRGTGLEAVLRVNLDVGDFMQSPLGYKTVVNRPFYF